jgi:hypothetical protein
VCDATAAIAFGQAVRRIFIQICNDNLILRMRFEQVPDDDTTDRAGAEDHEARRSP